jgi:hypothetical protein
MRNVLSTGEKSAFLGHLVSEFSLGAQVPCQRSDAYDDSHKDSRVRLPIGRLCVPATGRRPDVLGVPISVLGDWSFEMMECAVGYGVALRDSRTATLVLR